MPYTMEEFQRDFVLEHLNVLTPEERVKGLPAEELIKGLPAEERVKGLPAEERVKGLPAEERVKGLSPDDRLGALTPEDLQALLERFRDCGATRGKVSLVERLHFALNRRRWRIALCLARRGGRITRRFLNRYSRWAPSTLVHSTRFCATASALSQRP